MKKSPVNAPQPSSNQNAKTGPDSVYLMSRPRGSFLNDLVVQVENGPVIYHVKSKTMALTGRSYLIYNHSRKEIFRTKQEHTAVFPRHTILQDGNSVACVGQAGVIPQNYFIQIEDGPRFTMHISGFQSVYKIKDDKDMVIAEIAQHRATWIVIVTSTKNRDIILASIAIVYRLNTTGG
ncbi:MAG: hypothetical protein KAH23_09285 [Kiritimatiellae bacterium]|nr:hypothetical protein [Kiritimatiellia bacterium]